MKCFPIGISSLSAGITHTHKFALSAWEQGYGVLTSQTNHTEQYEGKQRFLQYPLSTNTQDI